jgi:hypothetical protein
MSSALGIKLIMEWIRLRMGGRTVETPVKPRVLGGYYGPGTKVETFTPGSRDIPGKDITRLVEPRGIQYEGRIPGKASTVYDPSKPPTLGGTPSTGTGIKRFR